VDLTIASLRPRRLSRRAWAATLSFLLLASALIGAYRLYNSLPLSTAADEYNIADWELRHFTGKWLFLFNTLLAGSPSVASQDATLQRFFGLNREIADLERQAGDAQQRDEPFLYEDRLALLRGERDRIENQAEATLEARVSTVAGEAGLTLPVLGLVWPPVDTEFTESPRTLVTSHRDRIELLDSRLLRLDLDLDAIEAIEARTEASGDLAALAFPTGGVGAYPTIVNYPTDYAEALHLIAHEWLHNYLFFYPLGFNYGKDNDLRAINETVADLVGLEIAEAAIARWPLDEAPRVQSPPPDQPDAPPFDLGAALRTLRGEVDALLAAGRIEEAETLMEQRRQEFAAQGFFFRRLNQAYFAFVNLYAGEAGNPAATNPIGPGIDELRRRSASLLEFVERIRGVTSVAELQEQLTEAR
jgi:hypothetical protein